MPQIHIIGGAGSGKSFVAAELSRRPTVPHAHSDWEDRFQTGAEKYVWLNRVVAGVVSPPSSADYQIGWDIYSIL